MCIVLEAGLHVDAVDPEVNVALGTEIGARARLGLLSLAMVEAESPPVLADQREERTLEVAGRETSRTTSPRRSRHSPAVLLIGLTRSFGQTH
jgi:hypothetical protein